MKKEGKVDLPSCFFVKRRQGQLLFAEHLFCFVHLGWDIYSEGAAA